MDTFVTLVDPSESEMKKQLGWLKDACPGAMWKYGGTQEALKHVRPFATDQYVCYVRSLRTFASPLERGARRLGLRPLAPRHTPLPAAP